MFDPGLNFTLKIIQLLWKFGVCTLLLFMLNYFYLGVSKKLVRIQPREEYGNFNYFTIEALIE
jgi:hypothetical protein